MENAQKFLLGAVGLIITVLLIYAGLNIFNRSKQVADHIAEEQANNLENTKEYNLVKYDGYKINGSTAINYIKTCVTDYSVEAHIIKGSGATATTGYIKYSSDFTAMRDVTATMQYINPLKEYKCVIHRDGNDAVAYVEIIEQ